MTDPIAPPPPTANTPTSTTPTPPEPEPTLTTSTTTTTHTPSAPDKAAKHEAQCNAGDAAACHAAALDNYYSRTPERDATALERFRKGCDLGYAPACNGVGTMYLTGRGVAKDPVEAVRWFRLACADGAVTGCVHLADALEAGRGVGKDAFAARMARDRADCLSKQSGKPDACPPVP